MSYIGKNPKVDSVKLEGSATAASGTEEGQLYYNTGTGSISKGLKVFKNSQFVAIDKQLGDADTMQLLKAADIPAIDFSLSVTSTTVGGNNAVPFESSTGDFDGTASFSNSSTGNALLSDESADLVFHYQTQATNNADNDFFGIPLTVPRAFRGGNLVLEFKYRTLIASGTMDDGYFNIAIQDRSAMISQTQASTISAGAISAGSNVLLTGKTFANPVTGTTLTVAVGDRVYVESGTGTAGSQDNDIVEAYITEVSSTDNNVKLSEDIVAVQSGKFVTGWLTSPDVEGQLKAAASDTNKDGTTKKIQFKTEADTQQISLWFFVKGTSTVKHDLFFDNILLSGNKFLQASSQFKSEQYLINTWDGRAGNSVYSDATPTKNSMDKLGTVTNSSTQGFFFTAKQRCKVSFDFMMQSGGTPDIGIAGGLSTLDFYNNNLQSTHFDGYRLSAQAAQTATGNEAVSAEIVLEKDEKVGVVWSDSTSTVLTGNNAGSAVIVATSEVSDTILLESQDEIFEDWTEYTPTIGGSTASSIKFHYRRTGGNLDIRGTYFLATIGTGTDAAPGSFTLPAGFKLDTSQLESRKTVLGRGFYIDNGFYVTDNGRGWVMTYNSTSTSPAADSAVFYAARASTSADLEMDNLSGLMGDNNRQFSIFCSVPVLGFNSNFNPLLSLPLVDTGDSHEFFWGYDTSAASSKTYRAKLDNITTNTVSTLGTIDNNSANGWSFQANQRVKVYFNFGMACSTAIAGVAAVKYSASNLGTPATSTNANITNSYWDSYRVTSVQDTGGSGYQGATSGSFIMEAGEYLQFGSENTNFQNSNKSVVTMIVEKAQDRKQLAHVIKPAVAQARYEVATNTQGGQATTGSWQIRDINVLSGESWFVSLASNKLTFQPGTYKIQASAFFTNVNECRIGLYDNTNSVFLKYGQTGYNSGAGADAAQRWVSGVFTFTAETDVYIKYRVSHNNATCDLGQPNNFSGVPEVYLNCLMEKLK